MEQITIRRAKRSDGEFVYRMLNELEGGALNKRRFNAIWSANLAAHDIDYFVADFLDVIVGFMSLHTQRLLHHSGSVAEIQEIFVHAAYRGHRIGAQLMQKAREVAKVKQCAMLEVTCNMKRRAAHRFYVREGMKRSHYKFTLPL